MNVALVYHPRARWPKWLWIQQALERLGHRVQHVRNIEQLKTADAECDLVLFEHRWPAEVHPNDACELAEKKHAVWMQWYFDLNVTEPGPLSEQPVLKTCGRLMRAMDLVLVKELDLLGEYRELGINAVYFDQGCPEDYPPCSIPEKPEWDVLVFGTRSYQQRREDARTLLNAGFTVAWAGDAGTGQVPDGCIDLPWCEPWKLPELMSKAAVTSCVDYRDDVAGFRSDRFWLAAGAGACIVKRWSKSSELYGPWIVYRDGDLVPHVGNIVHDHSLRRVLGTDARQFVMENHTVRHRCEEILKHAECIQKQGADAYFTQLCEVPREAVCEGSRGVEALSEVRG